MKRSSLRGLSFASVPAACVLVLSCTSAIVEVRPTSDGSADPSFDGDASGIPDAPSRDSRDAGVPERLAVVCETEPCYLAVSGNGGHHFCGLLRDRTVRCWGRDGEPPSAPEGAFAEGALGRGRAVSALEGATPAPVAGLSDVTEITVGRNSGTCARTSDGAVYCWGRNDEGQLGRPPSEAHLLAPARVSGLPPVDEVRLGYHTACAVASGSRALYCWGRAMAGLDLDVDAGATAAPHVVAAFGAPVKALAIGSYYGESDHDTVIALLEDGVLVNAGGRTAGETSFGPFRKLTIDHVARLGTFTYTTTDGSLMRWRLGASGVPDVPAPLFVPSSAPIDVWITGSKPDPACCAEPLDLEQGAALVASGRLLRWGPNTRGTLGVDPHVLEMSVYPRAIDAVGDTVVSFALSYGATCVSLVSGKVSCWGANGDGELGRGTVDLDSHPEPEVIH